MRRPAKSEEISRGFLDACLAELDALKPGNVHRLAAGHNMSVDDFVASAEACAPIMGETGLAVGERITAALRPADTLARLSGDEFIVVCPELNREDEVDGIAARLNDAIAVPFELRSATAKVSKGLFSSAGCEQSAAHMPINPDFCAVSASLAASADTGHSASAAAASLDIFMANPSSTNRSISPKQRPPNLDARQCHLRRSGKPTRAAKSFAFDLAAALEFIAQF